MTSAEIEQLLLARRSSVLEGLDATEAELASIHLARVDAYADDEHDPEGSTLSSDWSRVAGLRGDATAQLAAVDAALERLRDGSYGVCVSCGKRIPVGRLRVRPWTERCVECAA